MAANREQRLTDHGNRFRPRRRIVQVEREAEPGIAGADLPERTGRLSGDADRCALFAQQRVEPLHGACVNELARCPDDRGQHGGISIGSHGPEQIAPAWVVESRDGERGATTEFRVLGRSNPLKRHRVEIAPVLELLERHDLGDVGRRQRQPILRLRAQRSGEGQQGCGDNQRVSCREVHARKISRRRRAWPDGTRCQSMSALEPVSKPILGSRR